MKLEKLPSGSYRIQKQINGKRYNFTFDHKPTQKEIMSIIAEKTVAPVTSKNAPQQPFKNCAEKYLEIKSNVLSASTRRSYNVILNKLDETFLETPINEIDQLQVQQLINDIAANHSPKTCRNYHAFISAVLTMFIPDLVLRTTMPQKMKIETYIPTSDEVKAVLEASNNKYYIVFKLGCYGLRRSEILALEPNDICNGIVRINKSMVLDENKNWIVQPFNKTTESTRDVPIDSDLEERIKKQGYVFQGHPRKILEYLNRKQDQLGIHRFKFHALRHYFATELDQAGFSSKDIQKLGGWSSDNILRTVYQHNRVDKDKELQKKAVDIISKKLSDNN